MAQLFNIDDQGNVVINSLSLVNTLGNVRHTGEYLFAGRVAVQEDLYVTGSITANTLNVKNIITESGDAISLGNWTAISEDELVGKGLSWTFGTGGVQLSYRSGGRIWTNSDIDIPVDKSYKIDNIEVLTATALGSQITKSKLTQVGTLRSLNVSGDVELSQFAIFNSALGRLGLNIEEPNGVLSVAENNVEFIVGAPNYGVATVGTYSNSDLSIITDNTPRFTVKNSGEVIFGNEITKSAVVKINGSLHVDTLTSDTRIDRYSPLQFKPSRDTSIFGLGLVWIDSNSTRTLLLQHGPDRISTSESFEIANGQTYYIGGKAMLSEDTLGSSVVNSSLTSLGILNSLAVQGSATFSNISADSINTSFLNISKINSSKELSFSLSEDEVYYADSKEISIGNKSNPTRPVKLYGPLSVGITNPDPSLGLAVKGNISFANKKFVTGTSYPVSGDFIVGDICWNQAPTANNYVGWVCVTAGSPGEWLPFGMIAHQ